ncbi:hypothetical protein PMN64_12515 [Bradyrhizobium sp. UFLA01-814]|uniref:hypothetical protein n=1 Tax=Bradyrhizobium sp. UFLA01-814 TaxID=3023480 RepID=UPI00398B3457
MSVPAELLLTPLWQETTIPGDLHGQVVDYVENELSNNATVLIYIEDRGINQFYYRMIFKRALGTLPARHLFVLKWLRMCDYASVIKAFIPDGGYEKFMAQFYVGILHADNKASVAFEQVRSGGSSFEENRRFWQEKCLDYYTPSFDEVFSTTVDMVNLYLESHPNTPMAEFARRHLSGGSSGWATSR